MIKAHTVFDTPFEQSCEAITDSDQNGDFEAIDSEGVITSCNVVMITKTY